MARTIELIQNDMLTNIAANDNLGALNSTSKVSIFRLFTYIVAFSIWAFELLFDIHTNEVNTLLFTQKAGRLPWYRTMALRFQYGFDLVPDNDYFHNGSATDEEIEASKIIKYAAVGESETESRVIIKIAGEVDGVLSDFQDPLQIEAIKAYFKDIKWPGKITVINYKADRLYLNLQIKRNPLVLDESGMSKLDANYPVIEAIAEFMKELPFNGELRLSALIDKLQLIPGVIDATLLSAQSAWINPEINGYDAPQPIFISKVAISGYYKVVNYDGIVYVV